MSEALGGLRFARERCFRQRGYTLKNQRGDMKERQVLGESFLDGFGVAGLRQRLRRPGAPDWLFASEEEETKLIPKASWSMLVRSGGR